jgi:hypothetical protein
LDGKSERTANTLFVEPCVHAECNLTVELSGAQADV